MFVLKIYECLLFMLLVPGKLHTLLKIILLCSERKLTVGAHVVLIVKLNLSASLKQISTN